MSDVIPAGNRSLRSFMAGAILILALGLLIAAPAAARTNIQTIQNGDMIFVYEQNLDISGLRTGGNPVTSLNKYTNDDPATGSLLLQVPVTNDMSFDVLPEAFDNLLGVYFAFNPMAGTMGRVVVQVPTVSISPVLASPYHNENITGITVPEDTAIAFRITSVYVGSVYHAGNLYPATVDLVLTTPGGGQLTTIEGLDFSRMNVSSQEFFTDDPGRPGPITLQGLGKGTFSVQAKWHDPASWQNQAPDSNSLSFAIGGTTPTTAPTTMTTRTTVATTITTTVPTTIPTTVPTTATSPPTVVTTLPPTSPATTAPTPTPVGAWIGVIAPALAALLLVLRERAR